VLVPVTRTLRNLRNLPKGIPAWVLLICLFMGPLQVASGQDSALLLERRVKAAFLYKFLSFITWPDRAVPHDGEPLVIGVMGAPDIASELISTIAGRTVQGRPVLARALKPGDSLANIHLLFIDARQREQLQFMARTAREHGLVPVSDASDALDRGVIINFLTVDSKVRFEVSLDAAAETGVTISSRLLSVAYRVVGSAN
jgi:hypothetical protein